VSFEQGSSFCTGFCRQPRPLHVPLSGTQHPAMSAAAPAQPGRRPRVRPRADRPTSQARSRARSTWRLQDRNLPTGGELARTEQIQHELVCPTGPAFSSCFIIVSGIRVSPPRSLPAGCHSRFVLLAARSVQSKHQALPAVPGCFTPQAHSAQHVGAKRGAGGISAPGKPSSAADSAGAGALSALFLGQLHALQTSAHF